MSTAPPGVREIGDSLGQQRPRPILASASPNPPRVLNRRVSGYALDATDLASAVLPSYTLPGSSTSTRNSKPFETTNTEPKGTLSHPDPSMYVDDYASMHVSHPPHMFKREQPAISIDVTAPPFVLSNSDDSAFSLSPVSTNSVYSSKSSNTPAYNVPYLSPSSPTPETRPKELFPGGTGHSSDVSYPNFLGGDTTPTLSNSTNPSNPGTYFLNRNSHPMANSRLLFSSLAHRFPHPRRMSLRRLSLLPRDSTSSRPRISAL